MKISTPLLANKHLIQRRVGASIDQLRPQRWNWAAVVRPLDQQLTTQAENNVPRAGIVNLRYFWLDGLFSAISENFYLGFIPLFALAFGATNGQVGWLTAVGNLLGSLAFFPGARLAERGSRKRLVYWSGGGIARVALLGLAIVPFIVQNPLTAIWLIIALNGLRAFMSNLANPAWTALVADLVPDFMRGRFFASRNTAMSVAALLIAPFAGRLINLFNGRASLDFFGYQTIFFLAFSAGIISTINFTKIEEPKPVQKNQQKSQRGDLWRTMRQNPAFVGMIVTAFVWNLALQTAAPFFNVYLVSEFGATTGLIGLLASVSSLTALFGQRFFGKLLDSRGAIWVQQICGFIIPVLPLAWMFITASWQVALINTVGGFTWAGYNLANFTLLLTLTPDDKRPQAVALYQTAVFSSAFLGPLLGGYLADAVSFQLIFGLSFVGRLVASLLFVWLTVRKFQSSVENEGASSR